MRPDSAESGRTHITSLTKTDSASAQPFVPQLFNSFSVSKIYAVRQADIIGAGGYQPVIDPVVAQVTFPGDLRVFIKSNGRIGAGIQTGPTAAAHLTVQDNNAILPLCYSRFRTGIKAGRVITVEAHIHPVAELLTPFCVLMRMLGYIYQLHAG